MFKFGFAVFGRLSPPSVEKTGFLLHVVLLVEATTAVLACGLLNLLRNILSSVAFFLMDALVVSPSSWLQGTT